MGITYDRTYIPRDKITHGLSLIKRNIAYKVWRRKLRKYGSLNIRSSVRIIEVGSGPGYLLRCLESWFPEGYHFGLDNNLQVLRFSKMNLKQHNLVVDNAEILGFRNSVFNAVFALQVVEHLEYPSLFFTEAHRILTDCGLMILATPNPNCISARVLRNRWQGFRFDHISLHTPVEWRKMLNEAGFRVVEDGTTGLTGFKILQKSPLGLINWIPMSIFGFFPWNKGESYMAIAMKNSSKNVPS